MNRKELTKTISAEINLDIKKSEKLVSAFENVVTRALEEGKKIIYSNFGTFYTVHYPSKVIYHPKLGKAKQMIMLPTNAVKWMPSGNIKDLANSDSAVDHIGPLIAHGVRKITQSLNSAPKSFPYNRDEMDKEPELMPKPTNEENDDEVEIPIRSAIAEKEVEKPVNIYEEMMGDGSKIESTFGDAIRVHKDKTKSFLGRIFNRDKAVDEPAPAQADATEKVSLKDAGIFGNDISAPLPNQVKKPATAIDNLSKGQPLAKPVIETFRQPLSRSQDSGVAKLPPDFPPPEIEITPFVSNTKSPEVAYVDLSKTIVAKEILHRIPEKIARQYKVVPINETDKELVVAMVDPEDLETKEMIKKMTGKPLSVKLSSEEDINHILDQYAGLETELTEAIKTAGEEQTEPEKSSLIESVSDNAPAARIVTSLLRRAIRDKSSDIHIEPEENDVLVRFREDGILRKTITFPKDIQSSVVSRIKIMANMKIDEQRLPQDGRFSITVDERKVDFRVSTMPVANGEKVVMRVLDKLTGILTIEQLGIRGQGLKSLQNNLKKSHGMILVTGPTGSGKTTTLYALIDNLYSEGVNIVTLEDPIEYRMPGINQSQVNAEIEYTFASGLRSIVRQDPDIIMIGEIRDDETAEMAVHAALTGHIVLSTLHTNDSAGAAPRLLDMGVEPFLLTSSLNVVVAQRLARKICEDCKEEFAVPPAELERIKAEIAKMPEGERPKTETLKFYHGKGCKNCNDAGYKSRVGLYEVLDITEPLKELILKKESSFKIQELAIQNGMVTMLGDGILKALDGVTTIEEVLRITEE